MNRISLQSERGFTLLEVLLVLVLIGIVAGTVSLSAGKNERKILLDLTNNFVISTQYLIEDAALQGKQYGILIDKTFYQYLSWNNKEQSWEPINHTRFLKKTMMPDNIELLFVVDGFPLNQDEEDNDSDFLLNEGLFDDVDTELDIADKEKLEPSILIYPSGDMEPFNFEMVQKEQGEVIYSVKLYFDFIGKVVWDEE